MRYCIILVLLILVWQSIALRSPNVNKYYKQTSTRLQVTITVIYPTKINQVVSKMTSTTQKALQSRQSRIEIELPPGVEFGVEAAKGKSKSFAEMSPSDRIKKSNREAARLFTEMFKIIASTTVCMFPTEDEASIARNIWGSTFGGQVLAIDAAATKGATNLRSRRFTIQEQESALLGSDGIYVPDGTEVLILVGPRAKDMKKVKKIHEKLGQDTLIILLNGRATATQTIKKNLEKNNEEPDKSNDWISEEFMSVFNNAPPNVSGAFVERELLLYHEIGDKWYIAEKDKDQKSGISRIVGSLTSSGFKTIWEGDDRPNDLELEKILQTNSSN